MYTKIALSLLIATAALTGCGKKSSSLTGTWKVTGMELKPDSLVRPGMFDQEALKKVRFTFGADSSVTISDGSPNSMKARYAVETSGNESFLVLKAAPDPQMQGQAPMEQRMRIVTHTSDKLDLEQKFEPYTSTTHLVPVK